MIIQKRAALRQLPCSSSASRQHSAVAAVLRHRHTTSSSRRSRQRLQPLASSYTQEAITAIRYAQQQACRQGSMFVAPQHLLLGLFELPDCSASKLLTSSGLSAAAATAELVDEEAVPMSSGMAAGDLHWAPDARQALNTAAAAAEAAGQSAAGTPHLLLGVVTCGNAAVKVLLQHAGIEAAVFADKVRAAAESCDETAVGQSLSGAAQAAALVQQYQAYVEKHGAAPPQGYSGLAPGSSSSDAAMARTPEDDEIYE